MKKFLLLVSLLRCAWIASAQNVRIEYLVQVNTSNTFSSTETVYALVLRNNESIYFNPRSDISQFKNSPNAREIKRDDDQRMVQLDDNTYAQLTEDRYYKNYTENKVYYNDMLVSRKVVVTESLSLCKWKIISGADSVLLGFPCQKATMDFRGRHYEAWFSAAAHPFGGPWKFDGLPGLILSVRSTDNYFVIHPLKVILNYKSEKIVNPYATEKNILTWNQFTEQFENKLNKIKKQLEADSGPGSASIKITDRIEDLQLKGF